MNAALKSDQFNELFRSGRRHTYQKNEMILRSDDTPQGVYLIESGMIKIYSLTKQGDEHVHHFFGPGDFFPLIWTIEGFTLNMYYEALGPVTLWIVPRETFMDHTAKNQALMLELLKAVVDRYRLYSGRIDNLLYSDARERSAYRLMSLANRFGTKTADGLVINANITHEDMAHSINMTRETFGRLISRFQQQGIIGYDEQRQLIIKDLVALARIIGQDEVDQMWPDLIKNG
jgi:CRP/FNR family transcriptional regulator, cyclic AMP receptor protein